MEPFRSSGMEPFHSILSHPTTEHTITVPRKQRQNHHSSVLEELLDVDVDDAIHTLYSVGFCGLDFDSKNYLAWPGGIDQCTSSSVL
jgi:hypothetical protein